MKTFEAKALLDQLERDTQVITSIVRKEFSVLDTEALNWKPSPKTWNILECLDHMNIAVEHYLKVVEAGIKTAKNKGWGWRPVFKSSRIGNYFVKSMTPTSTGEIKSKMKTLGKFKAFDIIPDQPNRTIDRFLQNQHTLLDLISRSREIDIQRVKVKSAIGSIITFRLGDALRFAIGHNQRHIIQAQRLIKAMNVIDKPLDKVA
ncbi:MAG: DinB family protein [Bacteroidota bacterium]